jgi:polar amino acid transport system substrate-binding protein
MGRFAAHAWPLRSALLGVGTLLALAGSGTHGAQVRTAAQEGTSPKFVALGAPSEHRIGGLCIDILRAIERIEPDIVFVGDQRWQPFARVEARVANGELDAACGFLRNAGRAARFDYIEPPLFPVNYFLLVRADDGVQIRDWNDVRRLGRQGVVLVNHGFGMAQQLEQLGGLTIDSGGRDSATNLAKLIAGRGRFFIHRAPGIETEIESAGVRQQVKVLPVAMHSEAFHMIVSKTMPALTRERMRKAIGRLIESGEMERLRRQWQG